MLHTACFAVHCFMWPPVKIQPHLQHCSLFLFVCWLCCWGRGVERVLLFVMAFSWLFQYGADVRIISLWFSWTLSLDNAKFDTCAAVGTSDNSSICRAVLFFFAMKKFLMRSSSTFPRAAFEPSSRNLLKNVSSFSFGFCWTVVNWNLSNVRLRWRLNVRRTSYTNSFVKQWSIMVWDFSGGRFGLLLSRGKVILNFWLLSLLHPMYTCRSSVLCFDCVYIRSPSRLCVARFVFLFSSPLLWLHFWFLSSNVGIVG